MATKVVREKVIAFRLTPEQHEAFMAKLKEQPVVGARSPGLLCRKLALDYTMDELKWKDKKKAQQAPEVYMAGKQSKSAAAVAA